MNYFSIIAVQRFDLFCGGKDILDLSMLPMIRVSCKRLQSFVEKLTEFDKRMTFYKYSEKVL